MMIRRDSYIKQLKGFLDNPEIIKIIVGLRRCGKSVMLELIQEELIESGINRDNFISLNFEKMSLDELKDPAKLYKYLSDRIKHIKGRAYIFLDEIQEVDGWERCVNSIRVEMKSDIYLTGSNEQLLSGEYATLIGGRFIHITMHPFSFSEYMEALSERLPDIDRDAAFQQYLIVGGMPFVAAFNLNEQDAGAYIRDVYSSVVVKDIIKRYGVRNVDLLERILAYALANIGQTFSANSIAKYLMNEKRKVAPETVLDYLQAAREAYLIYKAERYDIPSKRMLKVDEKYYIADHGIREAIVSGNERDIERVLENIICIEMLRRGFEVRIGRTQGKEIDFICTRSNERIYLQVAYLLASDETIMREFGAYNGVNDNFPKYVLSMDKINMSRDGIIHENLIDFLLAGQL